MALYEGRLRGDPKAALSAARELLERDLVLESRDLSSGVRSFVFGQLGIVELWTGDLDSAIAHLERAYANALDARQRLDRPGRHRAPRDGTRVPR